MSRVVSKEAQEILAGLLDPERFEASLAAIGPGQERFESLLRDTANPTIIRAGSKFNVIPAEVLVEIGARVLPDGQPKIWSWNYRPSWAMRSALR